MSYGVHLLIVGLVWGIGAIAAIVLWAWGDLENRGAPMLAAILVGILTIVAGTFANVQTYKSTASTVTITVDKAERVTDSGGKSARYLIYTPAETFEDTDAFWSFHKTNSSDLYGSIVTGHKYNCTVAGWRVHVFSQYRNLISCQEVK